MHEYSKNGLAKSKKIDTYEVSIPNSPIKISQWRAQNK